MPGRLECSRSKSRERAAMSDLLDGARLIVRNGRAWLPLTDEDVDRAARAIVGDPIYREELTRSALRHTDESGGGTEVAVRILRAYTALQLNDLEPQPFAAGADDA